jgi:hypothetical protein
VTGFTKPIEKAVEEDFAGSAPATDLLNISTTFGCLATAQELGRADFACDLELSYLNGSKAYSPPDSTAGGGVMALAPFFPPIDRHQSVAPSLPSEGSVPHMRDWVDHLVIFLSGGAPPHHDSQAMHWDKPKVRLCGCRAGRGDAWTTQVLHSDWSAAKFSV